MEKALFSFLKKAEKRTWEGEEEDEVLNLRIGEKYDRKQFLEIQKSYSFSFPEDYLELVTEIGLCRFESTMPGYSADYGKMLTPEEIIEVLECYKVWTTDHTYFDEEDIEEAQLQQELRNELIPFQYLRDATSLDVYCFVPSQIRDGQMQVIVAYHDDDELECWFEGHVDKTWGLAAHLKEWIES